MCWKTLKSAGICLAAFHHVALPHTSGPFLFYDLWNIHGPPPCCSGQSSWLQIQRSCFHSRRYQIFRWVVGLERGPLSLVSTVEELLGRKSSGSGLETREYGRRDPLCWLCDSPLPEKVETNFVGKRRWLGRYRSLADSGHGVLLLWDPHEQFTFCPSNTAFSQAVVSTGVQVGRGTFQ
jgi:hypothetical protein